MIQRALFKHSKAISFQPPRSIVSSSFRYYSPPLRIRPLIASEPSSPRCYSTTPEDTKPITPAEGEAPATSPPAEDSFKKELEVKKQEVIDLKDKYLRSVADFRNLQDRTARDIKSARDFALTQFAKDLVDSIDNLDRALSTVDPSRFSHSSASDTPSDSAAKDLENLHNGLKMTERILMQTLAKHGLERFDPAEKGERFDPNVHEATFMTKVEGKEDGSVFMTQQKGFLLNGRVIRAAKVGVVKNT